MAPCLLGFGSGTFSLQWPSLTKPSLPSPPLFATQWSRLCISHSLSTLQSGFCSDHASLETPCKEIVNGLLRTKRLLWRPGGCGPPTVNPILCVPGSVLLPPISLGVTFSSDILLCLTPNSCVSQGFSFFLFFQFPFSSLYSYRFFFLVRKTNYPSMCGSHQPQQHRLGVVLRNLGLQNFSQRDHTHSLPDHARFSPSPWVNFILKTLPDFGHFLSYSHHLHLSSELPTPWCDL